MRRQALAANRIAGVADLSEDLVADAGLGQAVMEQPDRFGVRDATTLSEVEKLQKTAAV